MRATAALPTVALYALVAMACTCGDPAVEPLVEPTEQDAAEDDAPGVETVPPAAIVSCEDTWTGGQVATAPLADWDTKALEAAAISLEMTSECEEPANEGAYTAHICEWSGPKYGFTVALLDYDREEDAIYAAEDPYPGEHFVRDGSRLLHIEARNGPCGEAMLSAVVGRTAPEDYNSMSLSQAMASASWQVEECDHQSFDGTSSLECTAFLGDDLSLQLDLGWVGPTAGAQVETETDDGIAWWWFTSGETTAIVHDARAARLLAGLMVP
jgi:hypothetical protein